MKLIAIVALFVITIVIVGHAVLSGPAPTVAQASTALATTERDIASIMTASKTVASALDHDLDNTNTTPLARELAAFAQTTARIARLVVELDKEITAYDQARTAKMTTFNQELSAIKDPSTRRRLQRVRAHANATINRRLDVGLAGRRGPIPAGH